MAKREVPGPLAVWLRRIGIGLALTGVAGILLSIGPLFVWLVRTGQAPVDSTPMDRTFSWSAGDRTVYRDVSSASYVPPAQIVVTGPKGAVPVTGLDGGGTLTTNGVSYTAVARFTVPVDGSYRVRVDVPGARLTLQPAAPFSAARITAFVLSVLATIAGTWLLVAGRGALIWRRWGFRRDGLHRWGGTPRPVDDPPPSPHDVQDAPARPYGPGRSDPQD